MPAARPLYQLELDLPMPGRGETPRLDWQEVEAVTATAERESPAPTEHLMEPICDPDDIETALRALGSQRAPIPTRSSRPKASRRSSGVNTRAS